MPKPTLGKKPEAYSWGQIVPKLDPSGLPTKVLAEAAKAEARHIRDTGRKPCRFIICGDGVIAVS